MVDDWIWLAAGGAAAIGIGAYVLMKPEEEEEPPIYSVTLTLTDPTDMPLPDIEFQDGIDVLLDENPVKMRYNKIVANLPQGGHNIEILAGGNPYASAYFDVQQDGDIRIPIPMQEGFVFWLGYGTFGPGDNIEYPVTSPIVHTIPGAVVAVGYLAYMPNGIMDVMGSIQHYWNGTLAMRTSGTGVNDKIRPSGGSSWYGINLDIHGTGRHVFRVDITDAYGVLHSDAIVFDVV